MPPSRTHFDANDRAAPLPGPQRGVASAFVRDRLWHHLTLIARYLFNSHGAEIKNYARSESLSKTDRRAGRDLT
jgi:hypothetical protein